MAGFLFTINCDGKGSPSDAVRSCIERGYHSVFVSQHWNSSVPATLGDYINIRPGDSVFFFAKRNVYGIGEVVDALQFGDGAFEIQSGASSSKDFEPNSELVSSITKEGKTYSERWCIIFRPAPFFFRNGIDMDDLLLSNPEAFKALRTMEKRSFIQFDDAENQAFHSLFIRKNEKMLESATTNHEGFFPSNYQKAVSRFKSKVDTGDSNAPHPIDLHDLVREKYNKKNGSLSSEMIVEDSLLQALWHKESSAIETFGTWDYLSHQVTASPFKPVQYMDKIDVFGYRWVRGYEGRVISKYLVIEIKKDAAKIGDSNQEKSYNQLMKYVDWVCQQYAHGDYSMIEAYLVAKSFNFAKCSHMRHAITRPYVMGHEAMSFIWNQMTFVEYQAGPDGTVRFSRVQPKDMDTG